MYLHRHKYLWTYGTDCAVHEDQVMYTNLYMIYSLSILGKILRLTNLNHHTKHL